MKANNPKYTIIKDFKTIYTYEERVASFRWHIGLFDSGNEDDIILEVCSKEERVNKAAIRDSPNPLFYLSLPIVHDLGGGVLFPLTYSKHRFWRLEIILPSRSLQTTRDLSRTSRSCAND